MKLTNMKITPKLGILVGVALLGLCAAGILAGRLMQREMLNARIDQAKAICQSCPVITECATWALKTREPYGVWGGLSEDDRAATLGLNDLRYPGANTPRTPTASKPVERDAPGPTRAHSSA